MQESHVYSQQQHGTSKFRRRATNQRFPASSSQVKHSPKAHPEAKQCTEHDRYEGMPTNTINFFPHPGYENEATRLPALRDWYPHLKKIHQSVCPDHTESSGTPNKSNHPAVPSSFQRIQPPPTTEAETNES